MKVVACAKCEANNRVDEMRLSNNEARCGRCGAQLDAPGGDSEKPLVLTDDSFQQEVEQASGLPLLVDFWASWCGPCRIVGPIMDQLAAESNGRYRIAKLNVDENPMTASRFQVASIPTMLIFRNGALIARLVGAQPKQAIEDRLNRATTIDAQGS
jgi:thioredoxin